MIEDDEIPKKPWVVRCPHCRAPITYEQVVLKGSPKGYKAFNDGGEKDGARHRCEGQDKPSS